jgi:hypothetical protein
MLIWSTDMANNRTVTPSALRGCTLALTLSAALFALGCASTNSAIMGSGTGVTASDPTRFTKSGFLSDYGRLKPVAWAEGIQCWRAAGVDMKKYDKVMIARMEVTLKPDQVKGIDPTDLKTLTDYFHASLVRELKPQMTWWTSWPRRSSSASPHQSVPTADPQRDWTLIPYGSREAGSGVATGRPAGSKPYLGETGMEMQFLDGGSKAILAECRDTQIGRKYAADMDAGAVGAAQTWASGYVNSFQSWSYAKNAFDKWSALTAQRLAALRGAKAGS